MRMLFRTILAILLTAFLAQGAMALEVSPGSVSGEAGSTIVVPINISDVGAGLEVDAFGFSIQYDDSVLTFSEVDNEGTLTSGFSLVNGAVTSPGNAKVSGVFFGGSANITEPGLFLNVNFTINADATTGSDISLIEFKDDIAAATTTDGTVTLGAPNTPPTAQAGTLTVAPGATETGTLGATDADGDTLTFSIQTNPTQGAVTITGANTGDYQFVANAGAVGTDSFVFLVSDGQDTDTGTVSVTYGTPPVNTPPVAQNGALTVAAGETETGTLVATDADAGDTLTYSILTSGTNGTATVTNANTGAYSYTANAGASGTDQFTFQVSDGEATATGTITVTITSSPCVATFGVTSYEGNVVTVDTTGSVGDSFTLDFGDGDGPMAVNNTVMTNTYTPAQYPASFTVSLVASTDQAASCDDMTQVITLYKPSIDSPQSPTGLMPTLSLDNQNFPPFLESTMWKVFDQDTGEAVLDNTIEGSETSLTVPELVLAGGGNYTWTAQFWYGDMGYSVVSDNGTFTTAADAVPFDDTDNQDGVPDDQEFPGMTNTDSEKTVANNEGGWVMFSVVDADNDGITSTILSAKRAAGDMPTDLPQGKELFEGPYTVRVEETDAGDALKLTLSDPLPGLDRNPAVYLRGDDGTLKELTDAFAGDLMSTTFTALDGSEFDRDGAQNGEVLLEDIVVMVDPEVVCAGTVTIFADDVTGSGGGSGDFSDTVPAVFDFSASVSGGPEEGYTYTWTIEGETFTGQEVDNYTFNTTGDFDVVVEASKEGCPTLTDTKTVSVGEFHEDNCFIASSAAGVSGFFGLASLLAGLAAAVAWRKRR